MNIVKIFISVILSLTVLQTQPVIATDVKVKPEIVIEEPHWYEKPEILITLTVFIFGIVSKLINDNLIYKQEKIVNDAINGIKTQLFRERELYFEELKRVENHSNSKLNIVIENQSKLNYKFQSNIDDMKNLELKIESLKGRTDVLENRINNIDNYLDKKNDDFSMMKRL